MMIIIEKYVLELGKTGPIYKSMNNHENKSSYGNWYNLNVLISVKPDNKKNSKKEP